MMQKSRKTISEIPLLALAFLLCPLIFWQPCAAKSEGANRHGTYTKRLGYVGSHSLTTREQCHLLLKMMQTKPGKATYSLTYRDATSTKTFVVDLKKALLIRSETGNFFGGKIETRHEIWRGKVIERLQRGASGTPPSLGADYEKRG